MSQRASKAAPAWAGPDRISIVFPELALVQKTMNMSYIT